MGRFCLDWPAAVQEFAIAIADAIAIISSDCTVTGGGFACVWANSSITALAEACAAAYASGYASAVMTCKPECAINATAFESEVVTIVANATASAFLDQCVGVPWSIPPEQLVCTELVFMLDYVLCWVPVI